MALARATKGWTVADLEALPYDEWRRYEIIDGELFVSTAPRREHQLTCAHTTTELVNWNDRSGLGEVIPGAGVTFSERDSVQPDVLWVSHEFGRG